MQAMHQWICPDLGKYTMPLKQCEIYWFRMLLLQCWLYTAFHQTWFYWVGVLLGEAKVIVWCSYGLWCTHSNSCSDLGEILCNLKNAEAINHKYWSCTLIHTPAWEYNLKNSKSTFWENRNFLWIMYKVCVYLLSFEVLYHSKNTVQQVVVFYFGQGM